MFDDEPYGYDNDGEGWLDGENRGSLWEYDFDLFKIMSIIPFTRMDYDAIWRV